VSHEPRSERPVPDEDALSAGLLSAFGLFVAETNIGHAVGESGVLRGTIEVFLERGQARHTKGGVSFERRMELGPRG
jgi:hypothetical protein